MIAMNQKRDDSQQQQAGYKTEDTFDSQGVLIHFSMGTRNYNRKYLWQEAGVALAARLNHP
jgi:hypothetical protein